MVSGGRSSVVTTGRGRGVLGLSGVSHVSNIAVVVVGVVGHGLGAAIGKSDGVGSSNNTVTVVVLLLVEGSLGVVISHGVGEGVGGDLVRVGLGVVGWSRLVSNWSWGVHRGSRGSNSQTGGDDEDLRREWWNY